MFGQFHEGSQFVVVEGSFLTGPLDLDKLTTTGHNDVHIDIGPNVAFVIQIERRQSVYDAYAHRCNTAAKRIFILGNTTEDGIHRIDQCDKAACNRGSPSATIGLQHIAVDRK